jgi:hypothetical protein
MLIIFVTFTTVFRVPGQISESVLRTQDADVMSIPYRKAHRQTSLGNLGSRSYSSEPDLTSRGVSRSRSSSNQSVSESTWEERISRSTGRTYWSVAQRQFHCTPRLLVISRPSTHCNVWDDLFSDSLCKSIFFPRLTLQIRLMCKSQDQRAAWNELLD